VKYGGKEDRERPMEDKTVTADNLDDLLGSRRFGELTAALYENPGLAEKLARRLSGSDRETRRGIITVLGRFGFDHPEAVYPYISNILETLAEDPDLKSEGACALGNLVYNYRDKSEEIMPILREMMADEDSFLRRDAAAAIGNIGFKYPELVEQDVPQLISMLYSDEEDEREAGAQALGKIGISSPELIQEIFPRLVGVLEHAKEASCGGIISAFGSLGYHYPEMVREQVPRLIAFLGSRNPVAVKNAVMALGMIGMANRELISEAIPELRRLTESPDREIRLNAQVAVQGS
jgi:HEAT repeat protein